MWTVESEVTSLPRFFVSMLRPHPRGHRQRVDLSLFLWLALARAFEAWRRKQSGRAQTHKQWVFFLTGKVKVDHS